MPEQDTTATSPDHHNDNNDLKDNLRKAVLLALLGYAYIFGIIILLFVVFALTIYFLYKGHSIFFIKLVFIPILLIFAIAKSLWVKIEAPKGLEIKSADAPELFRLIAEIRAAAKSPPIHIVLLTSDFNCAISQIPRLGVLGFYKNYLHLGLPLLGAMPTDHFKAVLAHEMGHLSALHGRTNGWLYHVKVSWLQLVDNLSKNGGMGMLLFQSFLTWFLPIFEKRAMSVLRAHEYEADQLSASFVGGQISAQALTLTQVKGMYLDEKYWPAQFAKTKVLPEPPANLISSSLNIPAGSITNDDIEVFSQLSEDNHDEFDTHPKLTDRIRALQIDSTVENLKQLYKDAETHALRQHSAAKQLLGESYAKLFDVVEQGWRKELAPAWQQGYADSQQRKKLLERLNAAADSDKLSMEDLIEQAELTAFFDEPERAIEMMRALLVTAPDDDGLHYRLGHLLLEQKNDEGLTHLEQSIALGKKFRYNCYQELYDHYTRKKSHAKAQEYLQKANESAEELLNSAIASMTIGEQETFESHTASQFKLERVNNALYLEPRVRQAWLVKRLSPDVIRVNESLLVLQLGSPGRLLLSEENLLSAIPLLAQLPELSDYGIIPIQSAPKSLRNSCLQLSGALIYERQQYEDSNALLADSGKRAAFKPEPQSRKSFISQNRWSIIGLLALGAVIISLANVKIEQPAVRGSKTHTRHMVSQPVTSMISEGIEFGPYIAQVQDKIKSHWHPPEQSKSTKVLLRFKIHKDGRLSNVQIPQSSGDAKMDQAALDAINDAIPFPPLPAGAAENVDINFNLNYNVLSGR